MLSYQARQEVIKSAVKKYWRMRILVATGQGSMFCTREEMERQGRFKTMRNNSWFNSRRGGTAKKLLRDSGVPGGTMELNFLDSIGEQRWTTENQREKAMGRKERGCRGAQTK